MVAGRTTDERLALFSRVGQPAVIHEYHHNAPPGGTLTHVTYRDKGVIVDWTLIPLQDARRPAESVLLFETVSVPVEPRPRPLPPQEQVEVLQERLEFFWMMAEVTAKYVARQDAVKVLLLLDMLYQAIGEAEDLVAGKRPGYRRGSYAPLLATPADQIAAIRQLALRAQVAGSTMPPVLRPAPPLTELEAWLAFASGL